MKIAFPLLNETELAIDFAHSHFIGLYDDVENKTELIPVFEIRKNADLIMFFDSMTVNGLKSVASPYYSYMTLRIFKENEINTLKAEGRSLEENIHHYNSQSLKPFNVYESLLVGECAKSCSSCGTSCSEN